MENKLSFVESSLKSYGFEVDFIKKIDALPFDYLDVNIGLDEHERKRKLIIKLNTFLNQEEPQENKLIGMTEKSGANFLNLFVAFPFKFKEESVGELSRLLMHFNKTIELPGFGLDEINKMVFFRYSLPLTGVLFQKNLLIGIVGTCMLLVDSLSHQIECVANGESMVTVLNRARQELIKTQKTA